LASGLKGHCHQPTEVEEVHDSIVVQVGIEDVPVTIGVGVALARIRNPHATIHSIVEAITTQISGMNC
jgi:hypothetical protein